MRILTFRLMPIAPPFRFDVGTMRSVQGHALALLHAAVTRFPSDRGLDGLLPSLAAAIIIRRSIRARWPPSIRLVRQTGLTTACLREHVRHTIVCGPVGTLRDRRVRVSHREVARMPPETNSACCSVEQ
jgi:hypothetical protein